MNQITTLTAHTQPAAPHGVSTQAMVFDPHVIANMQAIAEAMAGARIAIPRHLVGSAGDCLAIVMQAAQWRMNPFAVAQKTHLVNGALGYEAQLVNAVVSASPLLQTRLGYEYEGDWKGVNGKTDRSDERAVTVFATLSEETAPRRLRVSMAQVGTVRNSPLWEHDPRQQLAYLATKRWARLHAPDVMLGVYTVDELQDSAAPKAMGPALVVDTQPPPATRTAHLKARLCARLHPATEEVPPATSDPEPETREQDTLPDRLAAAGLPLERVRAAVARRYPARYPDAAGIALDALATDEQAWVEAQLPAWVAAMQETRPPTVDPGVTDANQPDWGDGFGSEGVTA